MLSQESLSHLTLYPDFIARLIEDVGRSLNLEIDAPKESDVAANRIVVLPGSMSLADGHFNAGFFRRACQNHGVHMQWDGEKKPDDVEVVFTFTFTTMEEHQKKLEAAQAKEDAPTIAVPAATKETPPQKPAESKPSAPASNNSK